jgi:tRNA pseudouridine synthase 10
VSDLPTVEDCLPRVVELCLEASLGLEFSTFLLGVRASLTARASCTEAALTEWKGALKRRAALTLFDAWGGDLAPAFRHPDLLLIYDLDDDQVESRIGPVYLYGRYRKLSRALPQTRAPWKCPACAGAGCEPCGGSGKQHPIALEDLLGAPCAAALEGTGYQLHGLGREDVDVRCLGGGRPFVLEVREPRKRAVDLARLADEIAARSDGRVELPAGLQMVDADTVPRVKNHVAPKRYLATVEASTPPDPARVAGLDELLSGQLLAQRTPARVARRRADRVRERRVLEALAGPLDGLRFPLEVEAESGTYIKELISGDDGRTTPSVSALLGVPCVCAQLDVLEVRVDDAALLPPGQTS